MAKSIKAIVYAAESKGPISKVYNCYILAHRITTGRYRGGVAYDIPYDDYQMHYLRGGAMVEKTVEMLDAVNDCLTESKVRMETLSNDITALAGKVQGALVEELKIVRDQRQSIVREVAGMMQSLREVRAFFLEKDYETEMARLERFLALCKDLQAVKASGMLDAVSDTMIRLALKDVSS